jgi:hypothetical protein
MHQGTSPKTTRGCRRPGRRQSSSTSPFKQGEVWQVVQAFNSPGSHSGYAAFCWDFILVPPGTPPGQPQIDAAPSEGKVFVASAAGTIADISSGSGPPNPAPSYLLIESAPGEFAGYMHFSAASLKAGLHAAVGAGADLAAVSNVGTGAAHLHFAVSDHPESQHNLLVT